MFCKNAMDTQQKTNTASTVLFSTFTQKKKNLEGGRVSENTSQMH